MRMKTIPLVIIALCIFTGSAAASDFMRTSASAEGKSEFLALKRAYSDMTANVVRKIVGDQASQRNTVGRWFHEEINKDAMSYIQRFFKDEIKECRQNENGTVFCSVEATAKLFEFRPVIRDRQTDMAGGGGRIGKYRMVILRNPEDAADARLASAIHSELLKYGHRVDLLSKDMPTPRGGSGDICEEYRKAMKRRGPNSKTYEPYKALLETCEQNKDIARTIDIISSGIETYAYDRGRGKKAGSLILDIEIRNGKTGRVDQNLGSERIEDMGQGSSEKAADSDLQNRLIQRAAAFVVKSLNDSLTREASDAQYKASRPQTVEKNYPYTYTVKINGISDTVYADRQKSKMVRKVIEAQCAVRPEKDEYYSSDLSQVYRFGTYESIYKDELLDAFYEAAHNAGYHDFRIQVDRDGVFVVSFGG